MQRVVLTIGLARADYEELMHKVDPHSRSHTILKSSEREWWETERSSSMCVLIECTRQEAIELLELAKQHCPQAVRDIEYGLKSSR
jgi:hypothetical protein